MDRNPKILALALAALLAISQSTLADPHQTQGRVSGLIGTIYQGALAVEGWEDFGGGLLADPVWYSQYQLGDGASLVLSLLALPRSPGSQQATFQVADVLFVPPLESGLELSFVCRSAPANPAQKVIAVARPERAEWWHDIRQAWSVQIELGADSASGRNGYRMHQRRLGRIERMSGTGQMRVQSLKKPLLRNLAGCAFVALIFAAWPPAVGPATAAEDPDFQLDPDMGPATVATPPASDTPVRDEQPGSVAGRYLAAHFAGKNIAIIQDTSAYGQGLGDTVKQALNAAGQQEVLYESYPDQMDYSGLINRLKRARADVVFIAGWHQYAALIVRQTHWEGMNTIFMGSDAFATQEFWLITGSAGEGTLMAAPGGVYRWSNGTYQQIE